MQVILLLPSTSLTTEGGVVPRNKLLEKQRNGRHVLPQLESTATTVTAVTLILRLLLMNIAPESYIAALRSSLSAVFGTVVAAPVGALYSQAHAMYAFYGLSTSNFPCSVFCMWFHFLATVQGGCAACSDRAAMIVRHSAIAEVTTVPRGSCSKYSSKEQK